MSLVHAQGLGQSHGAFDVFSGISLSVPNDARIGLVGPNGIGKTTLLRILAGVAAPSKGTVHRAREARLGYLYQEAVEAFASRHHTIYAEMLTVYAHLQAQAAQLHELETRMAEGEFSDELFSLYSTVQEQFDSAGGYTYENRIQQV